MENPTLYRSVIGALQYATYTRPEISYIINRPSQYLQQPTDVHWIDLKRVLRYLNGTLEHGLHVPKFESRDIISFSDVDCVCNLDDRRSIAAHCVFIGDFLISSSSTKQHVVARSSTE